MRRLLAAFAALAALAAPVAAAEMGDDGLHKPEWLQETFLDLREDLAEAEAQGKRLMLLIEQRGCIYCRKMHEEVFPVPEIDARLHEDFYVVQINMFGDLEVTDLDGTTLPEKEMSRRWGLLFTPTMVFLPREDGAGDSAVASAVAVVPGAFGKWTTMNLLDWVRDEVYLTGEDFQSYHRRRLQEQGVVE